MKGLVILLVCAVLLTAVGCGEDPAAAQLFVMHFQQGVAPYTGHTNTVMTTLNSSNPTVNYYLAGFNIQVQQVYLTI